MKSRQRSFNGTAFKKDIIRFSPFWALYLIGGLMVAMGIMGNRSPYSSLANVVAQLNELTGTLAVLNFAYAALIAQLLYGDIFNSKLCNALHAFPLRRESWFGVHSAAGLLFSLVPNLVMACAIMPFLEAYWYVALLWLLGMELHYLFFFGLAAFSIQCTGNRFASILVYLILNFFSLLIAWFLYTMYLPTLYGIVLSEEWFIPYAPVIQLCADPDYFQVLHLESCPCNSGYKLEFAENFVHHTAWGGLGADWGYLGILAVLGVVFLLLALLLYRARNLESAGDFVAFKPLRPVFWVLFSLCAGGAIQFFGVNILGLSEDMSTLFLCLGLICGYFVAQMLLARTIKVFKKKNFVLLLVLLLAVFASMALTKMDPLGLTRYVPDTEDVEKVYFSGSHLLDDWLLQELEQTGDYDGVVLAEDPEGIDSVRAVHTLLWQAGGSETHSEDFYLVYKLKNGRTVRRSYCPHYESQAAAAAWELLALPKTMFGVSTPEALQQQLQELKINGMQVTITASLLDAIWADAQAGNLYDSYRYHQLCGEDCFATDHITLRMQGGSYIYLDIFRCCENLQAWLEEYREEKGIFAQSLETQYKQVINLQLGKLVITEPDAILNVLQMLQYDLTAGYAVAEDLSSYGYMELRAVTLSGGKDLLWLQPDASQAYALFMKLADSE